jgi:hypothetical protein
MRFLFAALALGAAACSSDINIGDAAPGEGYTLEVRANAAEQTYMVTGADGRMVAARASDGVSSLLDANGVQALAATPAPTSDAPEVMSMRLPGFEMKIGAEDGNPDGGDANVDISIGGADGQRIHVNADEGATADDGDDRAHVLITGADETAVRDFIRDAEELSPEVKSQMLAALGLEPVGQEVSAGQE